MRCSCSVPFRSLLFRPRLDAVGQELQRFPRRLNGRLVGAVGAAEDVRLGPQGAAPCVPVSQPIDGLEGNTTYHFRLVATTSGGVSVDGEDQTLTTSTVPPSIAGPAVVSSVTQTDATLNATINPQHLDTTYYFNYGRSRSYGVSAPATPVDMGAGAAPEAMSGRRYLPAYRLAPSAGAARLSGRTRR